MKRKTHQTVRSERRRQGKRLRCFAPSPASDNSESEGSTTSTGSIRANIRIQVQPYKPTKPSFSFPVCLALWISLSLSLKAFPPCFSLYICLYIRIICVYLYIHVLQWIYILSVYSSHFLPKYTVEETPCLDRGQLKC